MTRFVSLMASALGVRDDAEELRKRGVPHSLFESLHAPIGVEIGALSAEEISLSILAEIIATKHGVHFSHGPPGDLEPIRLAPPRA